MERELQQKKDRLDIFFSTLHSRGQFNGNVLIAEEGIPIFKESFGYSDIENKIELHNHSMFDMGSIAKQFTAMCIMILKEDGKLNYDNPITDYLPELPYDYITLRNLLTHTSGLPDWVEFKNVEYDPGKVFNNEDIITILIDENPSVLFEPGEKWQYSNLGYLLLGEVVERISGKTLNEFMQERIFIPLGMHNTNHQNYFTDQQKSQKANGYFYYRPTKKREIAIELDEPGLNYPRRNATEGLSWIYTTTEDMLKWNRVLYTEELVSRKTLSEAFSPVALNNGETFPYGFGWFIHTNSKGEKLVMHAGGLPGYVAKFIRNIDADKTIIILSNDYNILLSDIERITDEVMKLVDENPYEIPKCSIAKELYKIVSKQTDVDILSKKVKEMQADNEKYYLSEEEMLRIGLTLLHYADPEDALTFHKVNTNLFPESAQAANNHAKVYMKIGNQRQAKIELEQALSLDPNNEESISLLNELNQQMSRNE